MILDIFLHGSLLFVIEFVLLMVSTAHMGTGAPMTPRSIGACIFNFYIFNLIFMAILYAITG